MNENNETVLGFYANDIKEETVPLYYGSLHSAMLKAILARTADGASVKEITSECCLVLDNLLGICFNLNSQDSLSCIHRAFKCRIKSNQIYDKIVNLESLNADLTLSEIETNIVDNLQSTIPDDKRRKRKDEEVRKRSYLYIEELSQEDFIILGVGYNLLKDSMSFSKVYEYRSMNGLNHLDSLILSQTSLIGELISDITARLDAL
jgi:hypothetical protein